MGIPKFSKKAADHIKREGDFSDEEAVRIAATEMDGAAEVEGCINSTQTACPVLKYGENLKDSEGRKEGQKKTLKDLGAESEEQADKMADTWVGEHGGWTK